MERHELRVWFNEWACGCGAPTEVAAFILDLLSAYDDRWRHDLSIMRPADRPALDRVWKEHTDAVKKLLPNDGAQYFVLYVLTHWDVLEHGSSVGGSWLTDKGRDILHALEREREDGFKAFCASSCIHGYAMGLNAGEPEETCPECSALH